MKHAWQLYILACKDGSLYTGITNDVQARVAAHEQGTGAKYTRGRGPFEVMYTESFPSRSEASKRELAVKKLSKEQKLKMIENA